MAPTLWTPLFFLMLSSLTCLMSLLYFFLSFSFLTSPNEESSLGPKIWSW